MSNLVHRAWDSDDDIVARYSYGPHPLPPPDLVNGETIPPRVRRVCDWAWKLGELGAHDVVVRQYRDVFSANQGLVIREVDRAVYLASISQHTELDLVAGLDQLDLALQDGGLETIETPCVLCFKPGGDNYGHWLNEMLPRAWYGRNLAIPGLKYIVPAAEPGLAAVIRDSLSLLGIGEADIVPARSPFRARTLYGVNGLTQHGIFMSPQVLPCLDEIASQVTAAPPSSLYVTRRGRVRKFAEEAAVCDAFRRSGFKIVDPAELTFAEQVATFANAREIAGCMGAGMANIGFAPASARVTVFAPAAMPDTFFWFLATLKGQSYREVRCAMSGIEQGRRAWDQDLLLAPEEAVALATRSETLGR